MSSASMSIRRKHALVLSVDKKWQIQDAPFSVLHHQHPGGSDGWRAVSAEGAIARIPGAEILVVSKSQLESASGRRYRPAGDQSTGTKIV